MALVSGAVLPDTSGVHAYPAHRLAPATAATAAQAAITPPVVARGVGLQRTVPLPLPKPKLAAPKAATRKPSTPPYIPPGWRGSGGPCTGPVPWPSSFGLWTVPAGCYGGIYTPNPASYPYDPRTFGWCDWWPEALRPGILESRHRGSVAVAGAAVFFPGGLYGADSVGHYAFVVAVDAANPGWMLISEMNFSWRGGGFGRVDYRYVPVGSGEVFYYLN